MFLDSECRPFAAQCHHLTQPWEMWGILMGYEYVPMSPVYSTGQWSVAAFELFLSLLLFLYWTLQLLQQLKKLICDLCRLYNLPQHPDVEMLDQPLPAGPVGQDRKASVQRERGTDCLRLW